MNIAFCIASAKYKKNIITRVSSKLNSFIYIYKYALQNKYTINDTHDLK